MGASTNSNSFVQLAMSVVCAILLSLGLGGCREDTPAVVRTDTTQETASPNVAEDQEVELPEQVTRPLSAEEMPLALARAAQEKDILLLDRIAWCARDEDVRKKAEDEINAIIQACEAELISQTREERISILRTSGISLGSEDVGLGSGSIDSLSCKAQIQQSPSESIKVIVQKIALQSDDSPPAFMPKMPSTPGMAFRPTNTSYRANVEYAVLVGEGVAHGEHRLAFDLVFTSEGERARCPVALTVNVLGNAFSRADVEAIYATLSSLQRRQGRMLRQSLEGWDDLPLSELGRLASSSKEISRKQVLLGLFLKNLGLNGNRDVATTARQCLRIADDRWAEWQVPDDKE